MRPAPSRRCPWLPARRRRRSCPRARVRDRARSRGPRRAAGTARRARPGPAATTTPPSGARRPRRAGHPARGAASVSPECGRGATSAPPRRGARRARTRSPAAVLGEVAERDQAQLPMLVPRAAQVAKKQHPRLVRDGRQHLRELLEVSSGRRAGRRSRPTSPARRPAAGRSRSASQSRRMISRRLTGSDVTGTSQPASRTSGFASRRQRCRRRGERGVTSAPGWYTSTTEQRVDGHGAVGVRRRGLAEVNHHARLLAGGAGA